MKRKPSEAELYLRSLKWSVTAPRREKRAYLRMIRSDVLAVSEASETPPTCAELEEQFGTPREISVSLMGSEAAVDAARRRKTALRVGCTVLAAFALLAGFFLLRGARIAAPIEDGYVVTAQAETVGAHSATEDELQAAADAGENFFGTPQMSEGKKVARYYDDAGNLLFSVTVSGSFLHDGVFAFARQMDVQVEPADESVWVVGQGVYEEDAKILNEILNAKEPMLVGIGQVRHNGRLKIVTVPLRCSANGSFY